MVRPGGRRGAPDLDRLEKAARGVLLVSLMSANNETGGRHPIAEIGARCREHGALFHTDATQTFGKEPMDVDLRGSPESLGTQALRPQGVGAPTFAASVPGPGSRSSRAAATRADGALTLNVPGIVGLGAATASRKPSGARMLPGWGAARSVRGASARASPLGVG